MLLRIVGRRTPSAARFLRTRGASPLSSSSRRWFSTARSKVAASAASTSTASVPPSRSMAAAAGPVAAPGRPSAPSYESSEAERVVADNVRSGDRVYIHTAAAVPQRLVKALSALKGKVKGVETIHMHIEGKAEYLDDPKTAAACALALDDVKAGSMSAAHAAKVCLPSFIDNSLFIGANVRDAVNRGANAEFTPIFFSEVPLAFRRGELPLDTALVTVSPPDKHGFCSLGTSVDCSLAAVQSARRVIAQVNRFMPRTHGDGMIHVSNLTALVRHDEPLPEHKPEERTEQLTRIGEHVASLIPDGACLQMGIGAIPDAVLACLTNHQRLGIHTEMVSDGLLPLVRAGVVNGANKRVHPHSLVSTFLMGTRALYDYVDDNQFVKVLDVQYVNDPSVIARNPLVHAINSAVEVDLTGQVCADSIGERLYSGVGGQMDFMRGAALSAGGKPIIALPSITAKGLSRIVPHLQVGAGVTTTRSHVHYVVTEFGVASLHARTVRQRALALAAVAHPKHRDALRFAIEKRWGVLPMYLTHPSPPWATAAPPSGLPANSVTAAMLGDDVSGDVGRTDEVRTARDFFSKNWH